MDEIKIISKNSELYPDKLRKLEDAPDILFACGNITLLKNFSLAIVGSRDYTLTGKTLTANIAKELAKRDITIISGMARGIDTIAHESTLEVFGKTIAIIAGGFYAVQNKRLFNNILNNNGLILTEYFPDTPSFKFNFPKRNSIISALSDGVIVTEAKKNSGTLITATHALAQHKPLFTFPADIDDENFKGNNLILIQGANCILSYTDILDYYKNQSFKSISENNNLDIPAEYLPIAKAIKKTPTHISQILKSANISAQYLQYKLMMMELEGYIIKLPNENYILNE